ncbi:RNase H domain-containing protein [Trichonephila clavipes]|nr:RNase H domain-containing protein [Trichonephila clavipes]
MYSNLSDTKYHENYPFMRFFKITVPNVVGYLKENSFTISASYLEVIDGIPLDAAKIYTDGSKGETKTTSRGVLIELPGRVIKFQRRNADHASVFRTELIAAMCGLSFINNIRDLTFYEIWILTDSRSSIQHLSNWPSIGDSTSRSILHLFPTAFGSAPYSSTVGPFSCRPSRKRSCGINM